MARAIEDDPDRRARRRLRAATRVLGLLGVSQTLTLALLAALGAVQSTGAGLIFLFGAAYPFALIAARHRLGPELTSSAGAFSAGLATALVCLVTGGLHSPVLPVFVLVPSAAFATGVAGLYRLCAFAVAGVLALAAVTALGWVPAFTASPPALAAMRAIGVLHAVVVASLGALAAESARSASKRSVLEARARAEAAARARENFLAMMSHELRTPMTGILGTIQLLETSELDTEQRRWLSQLSGAGEALHRVLDDIIEHAASTATGLVVEPRPTDLRMLVHESVELYRPSARARDLALVVEVEPQAPTAVHVDPRRIRQVLGHLLSNAVKYTDRGTIDVRARHRDGWLEIEVADTGRGIEPDALERIFEPFVQLSSGPRRSYGGSGLGLANAYNLAHHLDGELHAHSIAGQGSVFTLGLPAPSCALPERDPTAEVPRSDPFGRRVLVVDDTDVVRVLLVRALELSGYVVDTATDGIEAVRAAQLGGYDAVVMDLHMPNMDGFAATEAIRTLPEPAGSVPILAVTADLLPEQHDRAVRAGVNRILTKPVDFVSLQRAVDRLIATDGEVLTA